MESLNLEALQTLWLQYQEPLVIAGVVVGIVICVLVAIRLNRTDNKTTAHDAALPAEDKYEEPSLALEEPSAELLKEQRDVVVSEKEAPLPQQIPQPLPTEEPKPEEEPLAGEKPLAKEEPLAEEEPLPELEPTPEIKAPAKVPEELSLVKRFRLGLSKTRQNFGQLFGGQLIDADLLEELETHLLMADVGVEVTGQIMAELSERVKLEGLREANQLRDCIRDLLLEIISPCQRAFDLSIAKPAVILVVGVNGVGKTTTIGKLANYYKQQHSVLLAAGDTFRAAAVEQLQEWGARNQVPVVAQHTGADSASVVFDAIDSARARNVDLVIADTAGRLHNKSNLMEELNKVKRVAGKNDATAPHEVLLVLDAGTGQNAISQMQEFSRAVGVTGIVLTKMDGTAKGGVIFPLCKKFGIPIRFIGLGEKAEDLQPFDAHAFVEALFDTND